MHCSSTPHIKQSTIPYNMEFDSIFTIGKRFSIVIVVFGAIMLINTWYLCYLWTDNSNFIELITDFLTFIANAVRFIQCERKFYYLNGINHIDVSLYWLTQIDIWNPNQKYQEIFYLHIEYQILITILIIIINIIKLSNVFAVYQEAHFSSYLCSMQKQITHTHFLLISIYACVALAVYLLCCQFYYWTVQWCSPNTYQY